MEGTVWFYLVSSWFFISVSLSCERKDFGGSSFVCVCNAEHCQLPGNSEPLNAGEVHIYTNSKDDLRIQHETKALREPSATITANVTLALNTTEQFQTIIGFGGAFTDSAGLNIRTLSNATQDNLLKAYFAKEGADYNLCRIPIAGSDFSTRPYSYVDIAGDISLENFALTEEDHLYKLPYIRKAIELSEQDIYLFGSPWSPPSWMKTNGMFNGSGELLKEMWQPWADYFVKFVESYEKELNIELWGLTTQNEPLSGYTDWPWNTCGWTAEDMRDWIVLNLGPTLEAAGMRRLKLMVDDYNRYTLPWYPEPMVLAENCSVYVDGVAVHWYDDKKIGPEVLDETHAMAPEKFMLYTEACAGFGKNDSGVILGSWERGEDYITNIIEDMNHWQTGWVDWNIALDMDGGPNWAQNMVDSPIIINTDSDEFYMQPSYFALTHFSRYVKRGAKRIGFSLSDDVEGQLHSTAFVNPDRSVAVILVNSGNIPIIVQITDENGDVTTEELPGKCWKSVTYFQ